MICNGSGSTISMFTRTSTAGSLKNFRKINSVRIADDACWIVNPDSLIAPIIGKVALPSGPTLTGFSPKALTGLPSDTTRTVRSKSESIFIDGSSVALTSIGIGGFA